MLERLKTRPLDGRPVRQRVAEGNAQLQHIRPAVDESLGQRLRQLDVREAYRHKGRHRGFPGLPKISKPDVDAITHEDSLRIPAPT